MIPFEIPKHYLDDVAAGTLERCGALLREAGSKRIVAHLQETDWWQGAVEGAAGGLPGLPVGGARLVSSLAANAQLHQLQGQMTKALSTLSALKMLAVGSLAASLAGIGVSAAGFALVVQWLDRLGVILEGVGRDVSTVAQAARRAEVRQSARSRAEMESLLCCAEDAWCRTDAEKVWRSLDGPLDQAYRYWMCLTEGAGGPSLLLDPDFSFEEGAAAYEYACALAGARVRLLCVLEQLPAALAFARDFACRHGRLALDLLAIDVVEARCGRATGDGSEALLRQAMAPLGVVREAHLSVASRPGLLSLLIQRGVSGRAFVEELREYGEVPLLVVPAC